MLEVKMLLYSTTYLKNENFNIDIIYKYLKKENFIYMHVHELGRKCKLLTFIEEFCNIYMRNFVNFQLQYMSADS